MTDTLPPSSDVPGCATDVPELPASDVPGATIRFGSYVIHDLIGVGGMAQVFRASVLGPAGFEKQVVIKRVKSEYQSDHAFIQMFIDEAKLSATLDHPHIAAVFDFGEVDGRHYLALEYVDGLNLRDMDRRYQRLHGQPLPWQAVVLIGRATLSGLDYAHRRVDLQGRDLGLIHRDVNPSNVLVRVDGTVKLVDFGIAKAAVGIRGAETLAGIVKGKVPYMSPEQAAGKPLDRRSDIFSLSILLHELLTGHRLFDGRDDLECVRKVKDMEIPDPAAQVPGIPAALSRVILRGLARDREARFSSAGAMADALEEILHEHRIMSTLLGEIMSRLRPGDERAESPVLAFERRRMTCSTWAGDAQVRARSGQQSIATAGVIGEGQTVGTPAAGRFAVQTEVQQRRPAHITQRGFGAVAGDARDRPPAEAQEPRVPSRKP